MSDWKFWTSRTLADAKEAGKPILLAVSEEVVSDLRVAAKACSEGFILTLVSPISRPDIASRVGPERLVVVDSDGHRRGHVARKAADLPAALEKLRREASEPIPAGNSAAVAWTGAVRNDKPAGMPDDAQIRALFGAKSESADVSSADAEIYAATEALDPAAKERVEAILSSELKSIRWDAGRRRFRGMGESSLSANARRAQLYWAGYALTKNEEWRHTAQILTEFLLMELFDRGTGALRHDVGGRSIFYAEGNALGALALLSASAYGQEGALEAAQQILGFMQTRLYDPLLGMVHEEGGPETTHGLLSDVAPAAMAFSEGYLATGVKEHREFADGLVRFMFQELWDREGGGYLDRSSKSDDAAFLKTPVVDSALNALALEACWRLHHLKGSANYRRWLEWGIGALWARSEKEPGARALAKVAHMARRGRLELELVGRPAEPKAAALLSAARRQHSARAIISFVDPDDQDYILAHKLDGFSLPRLFGCGSDLRRVADAGDPAEVSLVFAATRGSQKNGE